MTEPGYGPAGARWALPREYNFALDLFDRFRSKGWLKRTAYIDQRGSWTFGQLQTRAEEFSNLLEHLQVRPEERVLMCMVDSFDWPAVFLGTLQAGRVAVPINTLLTEEDYRFALADSRARVLVVSQDRKSTRLNSSHRT